MAIEQMKNGLVLSTHSFLIIFMNKLFGLTSVFFLTTIIAASQQINGRIVDRVTQEPLIGALIIASQDTAISDNNGTFNINGTLPTQISVQYLGYQQENLTLTTNQSDIGLSPDLTELGEVMVTAGASPRSNYTSPTSINVIHKGLLKRDAPFTTTNAINRVPGVLLQSGTLNTNRLTIRGIGSRSLYGTNKIKAYYDEIPLTDGSGNSTIEDIDQAFIDRIEVIKGPNSSIYGAGLGGVVKLFSHHPAPLQTSGSLTQTIGSFGMSRISASIDHNDGKNEVALGYTNFNSDGFRANSEYNRHQAGITARTRISSKASISTIAQFTQLKAYIPSSINEEDYLNNPDKAAFTWGQARGFEEYNKGLLGLTYSHQFRNQIDAKIAVFGKYRDAYEPRPFNILDERTNSIGTRILLTKKWPKTQLHIGSELFHDTYQWSTFENNYTNESNGSVKGSLISENEEKRNYQNFFIEAEHSISSRLFLTGGLNANFTNYDLENSFQMDGSDISGSYGFDPIWSPKAGLNYKLTNQSYFLNVSHGFSPPSLEETLYPDGQINPGIEPESGWNFEIGTRGSIGKFSYDLATYYMYIQNLLVAQRTAEDAYIGVNAGTNNHLGLDLLLNYSVQLSASHSLNLFYSGAVMHYRFGEFENDGEVFDGNELTGVPQHQSNIGLELTGNDGFYGNVNGQYVGSMPMNDANSLYSDDYFLLRTRLGYLQSIGNFELDLYAGVDNLTDTKYASMILINATGFNGAAPRYYYPGAPRSFYAGIRLSYTFKK